MPKKTILILFSFLILVTVFLVAYSNVSFIRVRTIFGTFSTSVFLLVLLSFMLGAFFMFIFQLVTAWQEPQIKKEKIIIEVPHLKPATCLFAHHNYQSALKELNRIKNIESSLQASMLKIQCLMKMQLLEEAKYLAEQTRSIYPGNIELLYLTAEIYSMMGINEKAKELLQNSITLDPKNAFRAYLLLRDLFINAGNWMDAIKTFEDFTYQFPDKVEPHHQNVYFGLCYKVSTQLIESNNYREALFYARQIQESNEQFALSYYLQAKIYSSTKDEYNFLKAINKGVIKTRNYVLLKLMENYYLGEFNPRAVLDVYKNLIYETRRDQILILALGLYYQRLEMLEDALGIFQQLHNEYPHWHELALLKAQLFLRLHEKEKALDNFEEFFTSAQQPAMFSCHKCGNKSFAYTEKCHVCNWWDSINLFVPHDKEFPVEPVLWAESSML